MDALLVETIRQRLSQVRRQITCAAQKVERDPESVRLVVVTKAQPVEIIEAAIAAGIQLFGENYAEEAVDKMAVLKKHFKVEWHMIGHVQRRKAALVAEHFSMLHSLDSVKIASRLERFLGERGKELPVLLEFNVSGEESKFGWQAADEKFWPELEPVIEQLLQFPSLRICGLMTMPPYFERVEAVRQYFERLRRLRDFLERRFPQTVWKELSMGTSVDYQIAVEEGATYLRVGEAILGSRPT